MKYNFLLSDYSADSFVKQISKALQLRTELISRTKYPKLWKYTDKMNSCKMPTEVLKKRRIRYKIYGILLIFLGFLLFVPGLMDPKELFTPLVVGSAGIIIGMITILSNLTPKEDYRNRFYQSAEKLYAQYRNFSNVCVKFAEDNIYLPQDVRIGYDTIDNLFVTEDFYIIIWNEQITVLQKVDLKTNDNESFLEFIKIKISKPLISVN